jgi:hypothetical protein
VDFATIVRALRQASEHAEVQAAEEGVDHGAGSSAAGGSSKLTIGPAQGPASVRDVVDYLAVVRPARGDRPAAAVRSRCTRTGTRRWYKTADRPPWASSIR